MTSQWTRNGLIIPGITQQYVNSDMLTEKVVLFGVNGEPIDFSGAIAQTGANVLMTGYDSQIGYVVEPTDSVNEALARLEEERLSLLARIDFLENPVPHIPGNVIPFYWQSFEANVWDDAYFNELFIPRAGMEVIDTDSFDGDQCLKFTIPSNNASYTLWDVWPSQQELEIGEAYMAKAMVKRLTNVGGTSWFVLRFDFYDISNVSVGRAEHYTPISTLDTWTLAQCTVGFNGSSLGSGVVVPAETHTCFVHFRVEGSVDNSGEVWQMDKWFFGTEEAGAAY